MHFNPWKVKLINILTPKMPVQVGMIHACLLFEFKLLSETSEVYRKIFSVFEKNAAKETLQHWFKIFRRDKMSLWKRSNDFNSEKLRSEIETNSNRTCTGLGRITGRFKMTLNISQIYTYLSKRRYYLTLPFTRPCSVQLLLLRLFEEKSWIKKL